VRRENDIAGENPKNGGFCADFAGAFTLLSSALAGTPVSTTHMITGAIVGARRDDKVIG
jgi:phosphate/sulfate permease